jgi:heptosyltransferase II
MLKPNLPQKILIVPLRYIGDTILTVPLIRKIHEQFPSASIDVLCSGTAAPLLETCPYIHQLHQELKGFFRNLTFLKREKYDAVVILRKSFTMALLAKLAGIPLRIGYDKQRFPKPIHYKRWGLFLTHSFPYPRRKTNTHQVDSHLQMLKGFANLSEAQSLTQAGLELWTTLEDEKAIDLLFAQEEIQPNKPIAVLHAASASHGKAIELSKYLDSLRYLAKEGFQLIATGTQGDIETYTQLKNQYELPLHIFAGKTSLRETFALYKRTQLLLSVDSSPIHIAAAAQVRKVVGVFGPTNHQQWGPYFGPNTPSETGKRFFPVYIDLECRPCYAKVCSHNNCKEMLTGAQIALAIQQAIMP